MPDFQPKIVAFVCTWCTYAGADLAGTSRIKYEPNVKIIRFPCTGRIDYMFLLKAFSYGADGIIISGCHPNDCHYTSGNFHARRRWMVFRDLADFLGIDINRLCFSWVSAAEGNRWAEIVNTFTKQVRELGPYEEYKELAAVTSAAAENMIDCRAGFVNDNDKERLTAIKKAIEESKT